MRQNPNGLKIKRVYVAPVEDDGTRVLVDRIWPRGLTKNRASVALWLKSIAPTYEIRKWFNHDPVRWTEFRRLYNAELDANKADVEQLRKLVHVGPITLLYSAKDEQHNNAVVLFEYIKNILDDG